MSERGEIPGLSFRSRIVGSSLVTNLEITHRTVGYFFCDKIAA